MRARRLVIPESVRHATDPTSSPHLAGTRIAILIEELFDDDELVGTADTLRAAGAEVVIVGPTAPTEFTGRHGRVVSSDRAAARSIVDEFDAMVIPGGFAPDKMRMRHAMVDLVRDTVAAGKPVAAISHGPQMLISAGAVRDRKITCWPSIAIDVKNAGGLYMDRQVLEDGNILTARKVDDVEALATALIHRLTSLDRG